MDIIECCITVDEFKEEQFEPFVEPPFGFAISALIQRQRQLSHYVVLNLVGALKYPDCRDLRATTKRRNNNGDRGIVINLKSVTRVDSSAMNFSG